MTLSIVVTGCDQTGSSESPQASATPTIGSYLPEGLKLAEPPAGVVAVVDLKKSAKEGDQVVLKAIVGGRVNPIVENRSIMTVVDATLKNVCLLPGDGCKTPWDYCCAAPKQLKESLATIQILGETGSPLAVDLGAALNIAPQSVVVVKGTVGPRQDNSALIVNASGLFVVANQ